MPYSAGEISFQAIDDSFMVELSHLNPENTDEKPQGTQQINLFWILKRIWQDYYWMTFCPRKNTYDFFKASTIVCPMSAGFRTTWIPAFSMAAIFSDAVPLPPEIIAPA